MRRKSRRQTRRRTRTGGRPGSGPTAPGKPRQNRRPPRARSSRAAARGGTHRGILRPGRTKEKKGGKGGVEGSGNQTEYQINRYHSPNTPLANLTPGGGVFNDIKSRGSQASSFITNPPPFFPKKYLGTIRAVQAATKLVRGRAIVGVKHALFPRHPAKAEVGVVNGQVNVANAGLRR